MRGLNMRPAIDEYPVVAAMVDHDADFADRVLMLVHVGQRAGIEAFESHEQEAAAGARHAPARARIGHHVERDARRPADAERRQRGAQLAQAPDVAADVVVVEADDLAPVAATASASSITARVLHVRTTTATGRTAVERVPSAVSTQNSHWNGQPRNASRHDRHELTCARSGRTAGGHQCGVVAARHVVRLERAARRSPRSLAGTQPSASPIATASKYGLHSSG